MSKVYISSVNDLHQQDGGMSVQVFADREGLTLKQARSCMKRGKVLGARQDARSKHWWVYPPAKLMERPRSHAKPQGVAAESPDLLARGSADTGEAGAKSRQSGEPAPQVEAEGPRPPAKPVLPLPDSDVYRCPKTQSALRAIREAAARQHREGVHYLRLEGREFSHLYAALDHERSRIRKLVGKGLADVCNLRASDSVWQKMQAMCREGKLL